MADLTEFWRKEKLRGIAERDQLRAIFWAEVGDDLQRIEMVRDVAIVLTNGDKSLQRIMGILLALGLSIFADEEVPQDAV